MNALRGSGLLIEMEVPSGRGIRSEGFRSLGRVERDRHVDSADARAFSVPYSRWSRMAGVYVLSTLSEHGSGTGKSYEGFIRYAGEGRIPGLMGIGFDPANPVDSDRLVDVLDNDRIFCSDPRNFNDPWIPSLIRPRCAR